MADSPASQVYSPGVLGDATVLGSGLGPLTVMRQEAAAQAKARANAARLKQQQEEADARNAVPISANGWLPHTEQLKAAVSNALATNAKAYQDQTLTPYQKRMASYEQLAIVKQKEDLSNEQGKKRVELEALAKSDSRYDKNAILKEFDNQIYGLDPATGLKNQKAQDLTMVDISKLDDIANNGRFLNKDEVMKKFVKQEADSESNRMGIAALPGGFGLTTMSQSNIFAYDKNNKPIYNRDGSQVIRDLPALMARAKNDPFMAKVLAQDAINLQNNAGAQQMSDAAGYQQLSPEMNARMQALGLVGDRQTKVDLATDLASYGKNKTSSIQSFRPMPAPPRPREPKANDGQAFETSGFNLNADSQTVPSLTNVVNSDKGSLGNFLSPNYMKKGTKEVAAVSHFPSLGHSFSTSKNGFVTASLPTNGMTVLGSDGVPNAYNASGSNSNVPFQVNGRQLVVEVDGKILSIPGDGTGKDAQQELRKLIDELPADQAKRARGRIVYLGSVTDKPKTSGDGSGLGARIIGYKDGGGNAIPDSMLERYRAMKQPLFAQYDQTTTMSKAKQYASREGDAQLARLNKGYNPQVITPEQADIIQHLRSRGGDFVSPYATTPEAFQAAPAAITNTTGSSYQRPAASPAAKKTTVKPDASRGGSVYKNK